MNNVTDLAEVRLARDTTAQLEKRVREAIREGISHLAESQGGRPDEWIDRKVNVVFGGIMDIVDVYAGTVFLDCPASLSEDDEKLIVDAFKQKIVEQNAACQSVYIKRVIQLLKD